MAARERRSLPSDLARGQDRFQAWRQQRTGRGRITHALWAMAVRLAKGHGVSRTATVLGLDYYSLKKRAEQALTGEAPSGPPTFVELPPPALVGKQGLFELDNGAGATIRVHLVSYDTADLEALARGLWGGR
jgi:hypothetical protein